MKEEKRRKRERGRERERERESKEEGKRIRRSELQDAAIYAERCLRGNAAALNRPLNPLNIDEASIARDMKSISIDIHGTPLERRPSRDPVFHLVDPRCCLVNRNNRAAG
jgi:hypothetical protein